MAGKPKKPKRTPVLERKRKKGVATRPPPKEEVLEAVIDHETCKASWKMQALCHSANLLFTTSLNDISVREISEREPFVGNVCVRTISEWCSRDGWVEQRAEYFGAIREGIKKSLGQRLIDIQVEQLKELDAHFNKVLEKTETDKPMSLAGKIDTMIKLVAASNELRDRIAKEIVPARMGGAQEGMQVTPKLTESEARAAAMAIMRERRAKIRAAVTEDSSDADEKPQLRLVGSGADEA